MDSPALTMQEYKRIIDRGNKTRSTEDVYASERFQAALFGAVGDSDADIRLWLSSMTERAVAAIQQHILPSTVTLERHALNDIMKTVAGEDWLERLKQGVSLNLHSSDGHKFLMDSLDNPVQLNRLHALGIFDGGIASNRRRWIRASGAPIRETAIVVCHAKAGSPPTELLANLRRKLHSPYAAYPLLDGNVLVINTQPKICSLGGAMIRNMLTQCGIPVSSDKGTVKVDAEKMIARLAIAKRKLVSRRIHSAMQAARSICVVQLQCWPDTAGFKLTIRSNGDVEITATPEIMAYFMEEQKLARAGWVADIHNFGDAKCSYPLNNMEQLRNSAANNQTFARKCELTIKKQTFKQVQSELLHKVPLSIFDYVDLALPPLLVDNAIVDSMLADLKLDISGIEPPPALANSISPRIALS